MTRIERLLHLCKLRGTPVNVIDENTIETKRRSNQICEVAQKLGINVKIRHEEMPHLKLRPSKEKKEPEHLYLCFKCCNQFNAKTPYKKDGRDYCPKCAAELGII